MLPSFDAASFLAARISSQWRRPERRLPKPYFQVLENLVPLIDDDDFELRATLIWLVTLVRAGKTAEAFLAVHDCVERELSLDAFFPPIDGRPSIGDV